MMIDDYHLFHCSYTLNAEVKKWSSFKIILPGLASYQFLHIIIIVHFNSFTQHDIICMFLLIIRYLMVTYYYSIIMFCL